MFGTNTVTGAMHDDHPGTLLVNDLFYTLQGEGPQAGHPAIFLRLARCNLRCHFCDTEFETGERQSIFGVASRIHAMSKERNCRLVVITGGEPLLQNVGSLTEFLNGTLGIEVAVETAGTVYAPGIDRLFARSPSRYFNLIVCSPKTPKLNERIIPLIGALKYVIREGDTDEEDGLPIMSTQRQGERVRIFRPSDNPKLADVPVYVSPMDEQDAERNLRNTQHATAIALRHGYRLSIQMHKLPGVALP